MTAEVTARVAAFCREPQPAKAIMAELGLKHWKTFQAIDAFVNADVIAQGLAAFSPESVAFVVGRIMLRRIEELARVREDFAFESTLAGRSVRHGFEIAPGQPFYATCVYTQSAYN